MRCSAAPRLLYPLVVVVILVASCVRGTPPPAGSRADLPLVVANDNRLPAGRLVDGVLTLDLLASRARWTPEAENGPSVIVEALGEAGGAPRIPAPTIRVPVGALIVASITNTLPDSVLYVQGLGERPSGPAAPLVIPPGETRTVRFRAGAPGTYMYRAVAGGRASEARVHERDQMVGAFVVDSPGARSDDRIFVVNIWGDSSDDGRYRNALAINGRAWPHTERIRASVGDTLRWRVINGSTRNHPMHLHGFYFLVSARGDPFADTAYAPAAMRRVVTEAMAPRTTMRMTWVAERPGNWLFHCHLSFHMVPERAQLEPRGTHGTHPAGVDHMAGLVLGVTIDPPGEWRETARPPAKRLRLVVNEGVRRGLAQRSLGYVLQRDARVPADDSIEIPGSLLVLTRGEATDVVIVNRLREPTAVHWHGIELESWSDGVPGWSGGPGASAPAIEPGDSFVAKLTLPRAGTFIYHTHMNDVEQLTSGLYGPLIVVEGRQRFDRTRDHVFVAGWDGENVQNPPVVVNGASTHPPLELAAGVTHRLRLVNIGPATALVFELRAADGQPTWRPVAKDGADLPPQQAAPGPATRTLAIGETFDAEIQPEPGEYALVVRIPPGSPARPREVYHRTLIVH